MTDRLPTYGDELVAAIRRAADRTWDDSSDRARSEAEKLRQAADALERMHRQRRERHDRVDAMNELRSEEVLAHLYWLEATHNVLDHLYQWDHDPVGYRAGRTCAACGVRSAKHALLAQRHTDDCHLLAVEVAFGIRKIGELGDPTADVLGDDGE